MTCCNVHLLTSFDFHKREWVQSMNERRWIILTKTVRSFSRFKASTTRTWYNTLVVSFLFCCLLNTARYRILLNSNHRVFKSSLVTSWKWQRSSFQINSTSSWLFVEGCHQMQSPFFLLRLKSKRLFVCILGDENACILHAASGDAGDRTPDFSHAKRTLYHWVTSPTNVTAVIVETLLQLTLVFVFFKYCKRLLMYLSKVKR